MTRAPDDELNEIRAHAWPDVHPARERHAATLRQAAEARGWARDHRKRGRESAARSWVNSVLYDLEQARGLRLRAFRPLP